MTSSADPDSGGVRFGFFLRLGVVDLVAACVATSGDVERSRLSDSRTGACRGDAGLTRFFCIERINGGP